MILLVNFGGPRDLQEIFPFLTTLLQDRDVIRTKFPTWFHNAFFRHIAKKRSQKIAEDYLSIGGRSPIYFDTEEIKNRLQEKLQIPVITFHRYLPATHKESLQAIEEAKADSIQVLPLFPQFSYATTGSIARFFSNHLSIETQKRLLWTRSYPAHPGFIGAYQRRLSEFLKSYALSKENTVLLFSSHGVPLSFITTGDTYQKECELSYQSVMEAFPGFQSRLCYQSKFGRGEWIRPYTDETCSSISSWAPDKTHAVVIPLTFTSDHIETLFEIEQLYLPLLQKQGFTALRCPALNLEDYWINALVQIVKDSHWPNGALIRDCPQT